MLEARLLAADRESATWQGKSAANNIRPPPHTPHHHHMSAMRPGKHFFVFVVYTFLFDLDFFLIHF